MSSGSYGRILKSSSIIGGAQGVKLLISMVSIKCSALIIGPIGIGLLGLYQSVQSFVGLIFGFGLVNSGVREIAYAYGVENETKVGQTVATLRRMCIITGLLGAAVLIAISPFVSVWVFGSKEYTWSIALLGLSIIFMNLNAGQAALIQGARRIGDLAKMRIVGAALGATVAIALYLLLGLNGIVPGLLAVSIIEWCVSSSYARRIPVEKASMDWLESFKSAGNLFRLGIAMMWASALGAGVALLIKSLIKLNIDLFSVGLFAAAYGLSTKFVTFILSAMSADFYPSLTALSDDHEKMTDLVNYQTEIGMLMAMPGLVASIIFAPFLVTVFYSADFAPASALLPWFLLGCLGRVVNWPMSFVPLAKGRARLFSLFQTLVEVVRLGLVIIGIKYFGLLGAAIGFFLLQVLFVPFCLTMNWYLIGFKWSGQTLRLIFVAVLFACSAFYISSSLPFVLLCIFGGILCCASCFFSVYELSSRLDATHKINCLLKRIPLLSLMLRSPK